MLMADQHSDEDVALDSLKSKGDKSDRVALENLKSKGDSDKHIDENYETIAEVALESIKSEKHLDEGESIAEVAHEALKSKGVDESMTSGTTVEINIKTLDSQLHNFVVEKNMPVSTFKANIASEVGLPVEQQRLIFRGKVLKDEDLLSEYHVESGHTLHLVDRQPSEFQLSSGSPNVETTARSSNAGQDDNVTDTHPRVGHVSHSVVLGTLGVGDQNEGGNPDVNQVIGAVLNLLGTGGQGPNGGTGTAVPAVPTLATPIPESLHTISEFMNHMDRALSQNGNSAEGFPSVELSSNASGLPSLADLAVVMRYAQRLLSGPAVDSLSRTARRLEEEGGSSDVTVRTQIQTEAMQSGLAMQHLGALLLELGRTMLTLRVGQSPAESSVNAGPAVYISPSGPNPIMVQPFPLQTNSLFGDGATPTLNHGSFGPVGIGAVPRHINIHIHPGPRPTNVESNQGDNMRSGNQSSIGQADAGLSEVRTDAGGTGNATSSSTRMKSLSETEGGSSFSRRNIPLGLGPGGLQPKRRHRQTRSDAGSSSVSTSGNQLDPATIMNQVVQNPALNNLLAGVSNQNGAGSQDIFRNLMDQLAQNPEMMNTVNQFAQQMDGNQDISSMLAGMGGSGGSSGGGGGGNLDMASLVQQMMPFVSQAFNSGNSSSSSSSKSLQSVPSRKGSLHRRLSSVKSMNTKERSSDFQMNLENAAQKIVEHYPPLEIFSSVVQTVAAFRNNVYDTSAINELCMEEELAQEFNEMLKRDISRRLQ